jgi:hypothetical protein
MFAVYFENHKKSINIYWILLRGSIVQSVPCIAIIFQSTVRFHLCSNHSSFIHQSSTAAARHLVAKEEVGEKYEYPWI